MRKIFLLIPALVLIATFSNAQTTNKIAVSLGIDASFASENAVGGPGFSAKMELPIMPQLEFTLGAGYLVNYYGKRLYTDEPANPPSGVTIPTGPVNSGPYEFIPVQAGLRYYYFKHFYLEGSAGEAFKANVTNNSFIYGARLGGLIPFNPHNALDLGISYSRGYKFKDYTESAINEFVISLAYRYQF